MTKEVVITVSKESKAPIVNIQLDNQTINHVQ